MENILTLYIYWDPPREIFSYTLPFLNRPLLWYGFFFALGFFLGYLIFYSLLKNFFFPDGITKDRLAKIIEKIGFYIILGTIIGARLGDVLFYQNWGDFVHDPMGIFRFWEGGLASHGGVIGVMVALTLFCRGIKNAYPVLSWFQMADLLVIPACIVATCIRIGNFFNQEILGVETVRPWGVIFGHPADGSVPVARHPVQIYEALFYAFLFFVLWVVHKKGLSTKRGKITGLFFLLAFSFRFIIEFFKAHQSAILSTDSFLDMGQILSIPFILLGLWILLRKEQNRGMLRVERD